MDTNRIREILDRREAIENELQGLAHLNDLIKERDGLDQELAEITTGTTTKKREVKCGVCGLAGHNSKTCTTQPVNGSV